MLFRHRKQVVLTVNILLDKMNQLIVDGTRVRHGYYTSYFIVQPFLCSANFTPYAIKEESVCTVSHILAI